MGRRPRRRWAPSCVLLFAATAAVALAQDHKHESAESQDSSDRPSTLEGTLVDAAWFVPEQHEAHKERVAAAAKRLAEGSPATLLPGGSQQPGDMVDLLTNATPLAPYAGATVKVEGQALQDIRAFRPTALYVRDGDKWRQVQLTAAEQKSAAEPQIAEPAIGGHAHEPHAPADRVSAAVPGTAPEGHDHKGAEARGREDPHGPVVPGGEHGHTHWFTLPPLHPIFVNFTAGLFPAAVLADWLGRLFRRQSLRSAGWWMLLFAAVVTPITALAGWLWFREIGDMGHWQMSIHPWLGASLAILVPALAFWRGRIHRRRSDVSMAFLATATVVLAAVALQGHLGATMSFSSEHARSPMGHAH